MKSGVFCKNYIAIVNGILENKNGVIDLPIARKANSIIERCIDENGDKAITEYYVVREFDNMSLLYITLKTGRTHQIRVHFSHLGHPIIGDTLYGIDSSLIARQALHACKVCFVHPITNMEFCIEADIPADILNVLKCK